METIVTYVVQAWVERYEYWANTAEQSASMFELPKVHYESEAQGRERLAALRAARADIQYRLVRQTTHVEEI